MRNNTKFLSILLALLLLVSLLAGCGDKKSSTNDTPQAGSNLTVDKPAEQQEKKETVMIRACAPYGWYDINVWAWKEGGDDVFEAWPGKAMEPNYETYWYELSVPGWVDSLVFSTDGGSIQTADVPIEPGKDLWVLVMDDLSVQVYYEDLWADMEFATEYNPMYDEPIYHAAEQNDYETFKNLLPTLEDRSILTDWAFNDFVYDYAVESIQNGDYETAIEFFNYCAFENDRQYSVLFQQLLDGDVEAAVETKRSMEFTNLSYDLDKTWPEIFCMVMGVEKNPEDINSILMDEYLTRRMWNNQPSFTENSLVFGENSTWEAENYVTKLSGSEYYYPVDSLSSLYQKCGGEANGKVLILQSQTDYSSGKTYYGIDLLTMEYLSYDLYPSSLSEVEYIILANYSFDVEAQYQQTFSVGENSTVDYFTFLRMKALVQLMDANGRTIENTQWIKGTGEAQAHFSELSYQCSNMPETGAHIIEYVEKVRAWNQENK